MGRRNQQIGAAGEQLVENRLRSIGVDMIEKIGTPVRLSPISKNAKGMLQRIGINTKMVCRVAFGEKVSGDRRGIIEGSGRSVLVETKTILDRNLRWSDLRSHQPGRLDRHAELGGLSLLAWVHNSGIYILEWPVPSFKKGSSIPNEAAEMYDLRSVEDARC